MRNIRLPELLLVLVVVAVGAWWMKPVAPQAEKPVKLGLEGKSLVLLVVRDEDRPLLDCALSLEKNTGVQVRAMYSASFEPSWLNPERGQLDADQMLDFVDKQAEQATLLLVGQDCYTPSQPDWRYCYGVRGKKGAVLSLARLDTPSRRDKMLARYAAELLLGRRRSQDPTSLFFSPILGPADLDRMELKIP
ncbi:hypothetical protein DYH09_00165 [bacterium CPR1]|nr:hypothetical protein [bacterium CPR1]